jgi:hypothetical protein
VPEEFPAGSLLIDLNDGTIIVTTGEPQSSFHGGDILDVPFKPGYGGGLDNGDVVALRKSPFSGRFKVTAAPVGNQLTLSPLAGATLPPFIAAGDLLIATVPASLSPLSDDLTLIAPKILSHLGTTKGPLNAPPNNSPPRICAASAQPFGAMTPTNLPDGLPKRKPANKANIVGLYDGGDEYDCGVFHPAGLCLFRTNPGPRTARFCQVCRYLIVDRVDPMMHKELDEIYKLEYPEP